MKKAVLSLVFLLVGVSLVFAQEGYRLTIRQVFPTNKEVYKNTFDFKRELDNAIASQSAKYRGNSNNYTLVINTPSGKETRYISNITWIQTINGVTTPHKSKTKPDASYPERTIWKGTACNIDGSPKGTLESHDFIYRVALGATQNYETEFVELETARTKADSLGLDAQKNVKEMLLDYVVYRFDVNGVKPDSVYHRGNEVQYREYLDSCKIEAERLEAEKRLASSINCFKSTMAVIQAAKDSLKTNGIQECLDAIRSTIEVVPDSIFLRERLDSVYRDVLIHCYWPTKRKDIESVRKQYDKLTDDNISIPRDSLMLYTEEVKKILLPSEKK